MTSFRSRFAGELEQFVKYRKASGSWNEYASRQNLEYFDHYCADCFDGSSMLTQEMIDGWCLKRDSETNGSCYVRTLPARQFAEYLARRGIVRVKVPAAPKPDKRNHNRFASASDSLTASGSAVFGHKITFISFAEDIPRLISLFSHARGGAGLRGCALQRYRPPLLCFYCDYG